MFQCALNDLYKGAHAVDALFDTMVTADTSSPPYLVVRDGYQRKLCCNDARRVQLMRRVVGHRLDKDSMREFPHVHTRRLFQLVIMNMPKMPTCEVNAGLLPRLYEDNTFTYVWPTRKGTPPTLTVTASDGVRLLPSVRGIKYHVCDGKFAPCVKMTIDETPSDRICKMTVVYVDEMQQATELKTELFVYCKISQPRNAAGVPLRGATKLSHKNRKAQQKVEIPLPPSDNSFKGFDMSIKNWLKPLPPLEHFMPSLTLPSLTMSVPIYKENLTPQDVEAINACRKDSEFDWKLAVVTALQ
jgi:hypothetical protein